MNKTWKVLLSLIGTVAAAVILVFASNVATYELPDTSTSTASADRQAVIAEHRAEQANRLVSENLGPGSGITEAAPSTTHSSRASTSPLVTPGTSTQSLHEPYDAATALQERVDTAHEPPSQHSAPALPSSTSAEDAVTPGAWCKRNMAGATGHSKNGVPMTCTYEGGEDVPRWRAS